MAVVFLRGVESQLANDAVQMNKSDIDCASQKSKSKKEGASHYLGPHCSKIPSLLHGLNKKHISLRSLIV